MNATNERVILSDVSGIARKSGTDQHGNRWVEFEVDYQAEQEPGECCLCGAELESGWVCLDGGDECCEKHVENIDAEATEPLEEDYTTTDHIHWYQYGKLALTTAEHNDPHTSADNAYAMVTAHMDVAKFWPNAWFVSDHGNTHLIQLN